MVVKSAAKNVRRDGSWWPVVLMGRRGAALIAVCSCNESMRAIWANVYSQRLNWLKIDRSYTREYIINDMRCKRLIAHSIHADSLTLLVVDCKQCAYTLLYCISRDNRRRGASQGSHCMAAMRALYCTSSVARCHRHHSKQTYKQTHRQTDRHTYRQTVKRSFLQIALLQLKYNVLKLRSDGEIQMYKQFRTPWNCGLRCVRTACVDFASQYLPWEMPHRRGEE